MERKQCLECLIDFFGRSDKKFCSDLCRNSYNNRIKSEENDLVKKVNNILKKNRKILVEFNPEGNGKISKEKLLARGFNFGYVTNIYSNAGKEYFFCYDHGYRNIDEDNVEVVIKEDYAE